MADLAIETSWPFLADDFVANRPKLIKAIAKGIILVWDLPKVDEAAIRQLNGPPMTPVKWLEGLYSNDLPLGACIRVGADEDQKRLFQFALAELHHYAVGHLTFIIVSSIGHGGGA